MSELQVLFGTGPVGCWTTRALRGMNIPVRSVNRSGKHPGLMPVDVGIIAADASDPGQAIDAVRGASVIYQALNPPYQQWQELFPGLQAGVLAAAKAAGSRHISNENLYMYDSSQTMTENSPLRPRSKKGTLQGKMQQVMAIHQRGDIRAGGDIWPGRRR